MIHKGIKLNTIVIHQNLIIIKDQVYKSLRIFPRTCEEGAEICFFFQSDNINKRLVHCKMTTVTELRTAMKKL